MERRPGLLLLSALLTVLLVALLGAPAPARAEPGHFVHADLLNLRAAPGGAVQGVLEINTPVEVLQLRDSWARVRVPDGREGWVGADFLGEDRLFWYNTEARAQEATDPAEAVTWWERTVALSDGEDRHEAALEAALRRAGRAEDADAVHARRRARADRGWNAWLNDTQRREASEITRGLETVSNNQELRRLWDRARPLAEQTWLSLEHLGGVDSPHRQAYAAMAALYFPWASFGFEAEGTTGVLRLDGPAWAEAARRTPSMDDDDFFAFTQAYWQGYADESPFPQWFAQTWDYGGCQLVGSGHFVSALDAVNPLMFSDYWADQAGSYRERLLGDLMRRANWCRVDDGYPNAFPSEEQRRSEIDRLLRSEVLTQQEKALIRALDLNASADAANPAGG